MSKKLGFTLSGIMLAIAAGTVFVANDMDGGRLNTSGLIVDDTYEAHVDDDDKDGLILLQTATVAEIIDGVLDTTVGAKAKPFSITIDCDKADPTPSATAEMTFGPVFFGNSKGTLDSDTSINTPSDGVSITLHNIGGSTIKRVQVNNSDDVYSKTLDSTSKSTTYNFKASYVRTDASKTITTGYVEANSAYTITYQ